MENRGVNLGPIRGARTVKDVVSRLSCSMNVYLLLLSKLGYCTNGKDTETI